LKYNNNIVDFFSAKKKYVTLNSTKSTKAKASQKPKKVIAKRQSFGGRAAPAKKSADLSANTIAKFDLYLNFKSNAWYMKPHAVSSLPERTKILSYFFVMATYVVTISISNQQICAVNRGEGLGVLTVKVQLPPSLYSEFVQYVSDKWLGKNIENFMVTTSLGVLLIS